MLPPLRRGEDISLTNALSPQGDGLIFGCCFDDAERKRAGMMSLALMRPIREINEKFAS